jgi:hypothetical protein
MITEFNLSLNEEYEFLPSTPPTSKKNYTKLVTRTDLISNIPADYRLIFDKNQHVKLKNMTILPLQNRIILQSDHNYEYDVRHKHNVHCQSHIFLY